MWLSSAVAKAENNNALEPFGWAVFAPGEPILPEPAEATPRAECESQPVKVSQPEKSEVEKLLDELTRVKADDMGRLGTVIQKIAKLQEGNDRSTIAKAIREKLGPKAYKKHKRRDYLDELIGNGGD